MRSRVLERCTISMLFSSNLPTIFFKNQIHDFVQIFYTSFRHVAKCGKWRNLLGSLWYGHWNFGKMHRFYSYFLLTCLFITWFIELRGCGRWFIYSPIKITYITWYLYHSLSHQITSTVVLHLDVMGISTVIYSYNYSLCSKKMSGHGLVKFSGNSVILFIIPITLNFT